MVVQCPCLWSFWLPRLLSREETLILALKTSIPELDMNTSCGKVNAKYTSDSEPIVSKLGTRIKSDRFLKPRTHLNIRHTWQKNVQVVRDFKS